MEVCHYNSEVTVLVQCATDIKPFYLHGFDESKSHLCPVKALAEWLDVCDHTEGYLFRRVLAGDRVDPESRPMVGTQFNTLVTLLTAHSRIKKSWTYSDTISSTLGRTQGHMEPIHSDVEGVNGLQVVVSGPYQEYVTGVAGVWISRVQQ
jgi:hypothetical protein